MKSLQHLRTLLCCAAAACTPLAQAEETLVAGWDFSQYAAYSLIGLDYTFTDHLWANFSGLDQSGNSIAFSGPDEYHYGTFYYGGQFGSDALVDSSDIFRGITTSGDLSANSEAAIHPQWGAGFNDTSKTSFLLEEGQGFVNSIMLDFAPDMAGQKIVFQANVGAGREGYGWALSYAGKLSLFGATTISWEYSADGVNYTNTGIVHTLTPEAASYSLDAAALAGLEGAGAVYFRATLGAFGDVTDSPQMDNVAIRANVLPADPFDGKQLYANFYTSPWFGLYWRSPESPEWYYTLAGWVRPEPDADGVGVWLWAHDGRQDEWRWFYTEPGVFPWLWDEANGKWVLAPVLLLTSL
ncbi:MAG: hypothetical protein Q7P63_08475 [Verrucomicrobiota bacterium JB022]|nr:hypothetical protein [Verrucomicrobiota bacterium JB022]